MYLILWHHEQDLEGSPIVSETERAALVQHMGGRPAQYLKVLSGFRVMTLRFRSLWLTKTMSLCLEWQGKKQSLSCKSRTEHWRISRAVWLMSPGRRLFWKSWPSYGSRFNMQHGTTDWFNNCSGYRFIKDYSSGLGVFVSEVNISATASPQPIHW